MALQEPVGPQIRVRLPGRQQVPGDHQDRVRDRHDRLLVAPLSLPPGVLAGQSRCPCPGPRRWPPRSARPAAIGRPCRWWPRGACRPTRGCPGSSPPSSPGARPRELAPVGADLGQEDLSGPLADPGMVLTRASSGERGATTRATWLRSRSMASARSSRCPSSSPSSGACWARTRPSSASPSAGSLARRRPSASTAGSWVPATRPSPTARPETPSTSAATVPSVIRRPPRPAAAAGPPGSAHRAAPCGRGSDPAAPGSAGGTNQGRTRPWATSWPIATAAATSVLGPGTVPRWAAFSSQHRQSSSSRTDSGRQDTPVDSIPTTVTAWLAVQSPSSTSPAVVARTDRVGCSRPPTGRGPRPWR
jgi:hypothetical protein